jgi:hypothetical protein
LFRHDEDGSIVRKKIIHEPVIRMMLQLPQGRLLKVLSLTLAVMTGNTEIVHCLLAEGVEITVQSVRPAGSLVLPIAIAAALENIEMLNRFQGASRRPRRDSAAALIEACTFKMSWAVDFLLRAEVDVDIPWRNGNNDSAIDRC